MKSYDEINKKRVVEGMNGWLRILMSCGVGLFMWRVVVNY